jgi:hypothetical protein
MWLRLDLRERQILNAEDAEDAEDAEVSQKAQKRNTKLIGLKAHKKNLECALQQSGLLFLCLFLRLLRDLCVFCVRYLKYSYA